MKERFLLSTFFITFFIFSQQKRYDIIWEDSQTISTGSYSIQIPASNKENFSYDFDQGMQFVAQWEINGFIDESNAVVSNVTYSNISVSELKDLDLKKIPNKLTYSLKNSTVANDGVRLNGQLVKLDFTALGEIVFRGQASVKNGVFDFVVPKDIGIPVGFGKVSFYAKKGEALEDQTGANINTIKIGGVNENAKIDNIGPVISLYMNEGIFVSGGIINEFPTLLVKLEDANGINAASGIGHDSVAIIDGGETNPYILNGYYQTELDNYQKGVVSFPFRDLSSGLHTLTLKARDVYNNSSTFEIQFVVYDKDQELVINNVLNYPNPFVNYTEFWFNHNSSTPLDVSIQIFTVSGKLVRTLNGQTSAGITNASSLSRDIVWDGRDDFGDKIGKGVYIHKLTVHSPA